MYLKFDNIDQFNVFNSKMNALLGYPTPDKQTLNYCEAIQHPKDITVMASVDERCTTDISSKEKPLDVPRIEYCRDPLQNPKAVITADASIKG